MSTTKHTKNTLTIEAVYENGVFRPLQPISNEIKDGEKVRLSLYTISAALKALEDLTHIYDGLSDKEIEEIEEVILRRSDYPGTLQTSDADSRVRQRS